MPNPARVSPDSPALQFHFSRSSAAIPASFAPIRPIASDPSGKRRPDAGSVTVDFAVVPGQVVVGDRFGTRRTMTETGGEHARFDDGHPDPERRQFLGHRRRCSPAGRAGRTGPMPRRRLQWRCAHRSRRGRGSAAARARQGRTAPGRGRWPPPRRVRPVPAGPVPGRSSSRPRARSAPVTSQTRIARPARPGRISSRRRPRSAPRSCPRSRRRARADRRTR